MRNRSQWRSRLCHSCLLGKSSGLQNLPNNLQLRTNRRQRNRGSSKNRRKTRNNHQNYRPLRTQRNLQRRNLSLQHRIPLTSEFSAPIIVPFRNAIFLSAAVAYAVTVGADKIFYGAQGSDEPFYPDCRKEFYEALRRQHDWAHVKKLLSKHHLVAGKKSDLIKEGTKLGVPFELTWSCYREKRNIAANANPV